MGPSPVAPSGPVAPVVPAGPVEPWHLVAPSPPLHPRRSPLLRPPRLLLAGRTNAPEGPLGPVGPIGPSLRLWDQSPLPGRSHL